eukprot:scaffold121525_cov34-Tisochrysis_lutea.AAC.1
MERAPLPSSPAPAAHPAATDDRAMLDASHPKRPREGAPPTQVHTMRDPRHPQTPTTLSRTGTPCKMMHTYLVETLLAAGPKGPGRQAPLPR